MAAVIIYKAKGYHGRRRRKSRKKEEKHGKEEATGGTQAPAGEDEALR
jgi:hypothetical protein